MPPEILGALEAIQEAIDFIEADTAGLTYEAFVANRQVRQLVVYNFEVIGEAVNRLRRHAPEISGRIQSADRFIGFRNHLVHGYDRIDYPTVWSVVQDALPVLRAEVEALLRDAAEQ